MRLIDGDALSLEMKARQDACKEWVDTASDAGIKARAEGALSAFAEFKLTIDKQQTVDAVPVVRCADCKHSERWSRDHRICFLWAEQGKGIDVADDGFCNYGERKDGKDGDADGREAD